MLCGGFMTVLLTCIFPGKTDMEPESRQLELEDVWLASQVEPLQDNFDVLGRFLPVYESRLNCNPCQL